MALYAAVFSDWANTSFKGVAGRISAYGALRLKYPNNVVVPNQGLNLKIFGTGAILYSALDPNVELIPIPAEGYEVSSPKNSINANDYILGSTAEVQILLEVG